MTEDFDDIDFEELIPAKKQKVTNSGFPNVDSPPPYVSYNDKYLELQEYSFEIDEGSDISDIVVYIERIQKFRSRLIQLEQEAERNYVSIDLTYDVLYASEFMQRPEKTQKEKEAATLVKLQAWARAQSEAKIYAGACKRFREHLDATHHLLTKILSAKQLEVQIRAYEGKANESKFTTPVQELKWTD